MKPVKSGCWQIWTLLHPIKMQLKEKQKAAEQLLTRRSEKKQRTCDVDPMCSTSLVLHVLSKT